MTLRPLALPACCAALCAMGLWMAGPIPPRAAPPPRPEKIERDERPPTFAELAEAKRIYKSLGGGHSKDEDRGKVYHTFVPPRPLTAEVVAKLPDLAFDYTLALSVGPDTPPGTLKALARLHNLRSVSLGFDYISQFDRPGKQDRFDPAPFIAELAAVPNLQRLDLYSGFERLLLSDEVAALLPGFPSLRRVAGEGPITDAGLAHLARCQKLESVSLQSCKGITDDGLAHLAAMPTLRNLVIQDCPRPTAAGIRHFTKEPRLVGLAIGGRDMKEDALEEAGKITTLEWLNLTTFRKDVHSDRCLVHFGRLPQLTILFLGKGILPTDAGLKALAESHSLEEVWALGCIHVTDAGYRELARIKTLKFLYMRADLMTDDGLGALAQLPNLESFIVAVAPRVTDDGWLAFAERRGRTLTNLHISFAPVSDRFIAELPRLAPDLEGLGLYECKAITDQSIPALVSLRRLSQLNVNDTSITPDGTESLRKQRPACRIDGPSRPR